ncbi:PqqD family protein [Sphingomonas alpina]|uniref:PqqD family protein n=1 Tax=Sphingomonas alpina TaxID=653931 RepID=A0A7H0LKZ0_9SPHN|nr:PqqD family protein [Sphingomonas alpina]QNQ10343.1 PqqD family protein [Sphingomonas alpina]
MSDVRVRRAPDLITAPLDDGAMIMDIAGGNFLELNRTAARIWDLLDTPNTVSGLCALMLDRYDVTPELCAAQIEAWMADMREQKLIVVEQD